MLDNVSCLLVALTASIKPWPNDHNTPMQHITTLLVCIWQPCCDVLDVVGSNLTVFQTSTNMSQKGGKQCNLHFAFQNVSIVWPGLHVFCLSKCLDLENVKFKSKSYENPLFIHPCTVPPQTGTMGAVRNCSAKTRDQRK